MADNAEMVILEGENLVGKLASSFPEEQQKQIARDVFLAMQMKSVGVGDKKRKFTAFEALSYVMACGELQLNPVLNHVIMLEDQFYITLQGHLQNAHKSGQLVGLSTELVSVEEVEVMKRDWDLKKDVPVKVKQFRYKCVIRKKMGNDVAEFSAIGVSDKTNVTGGDKKTEIAIEQMAEARAMRRTLSRAFPVGLGNYEDAIDAEEIGLKFHEEKSETTKEAGKLMSAKKPKAKEEPIPQNVEPQPEPVVKESVTTEPKQTAPELETSEPEIPESGTVEAQVAESGEPQTEPVPTAEELADVFAGEEPKEPTLKELEDQVMIARVEFNRALTNHKANPNAETEAAKTAAAGAVVVLNRKIAAINAANGGQ